MRVHLEPPGRILLKELTDPVTVHVPVHQKGIAPVSATIHFDVLAGRL